MELRTYAEAQAFLHNTQAELESSEAANSLMLGICARLVRYPERIAAAPCLKTVHDQDGETVRLRIADGDIHVWDDGGPVSMAVRTRLTRKGISIGPVYTPPEQRRRGYATACVGELSRLLLAAGREFCALFVDRANPEAVCVYRRIGYRPVADYDEYLFTSSDE
jgi:predicted GNAT family acetyltransferase